MHVLAHFGIQPTRLTKTICFDYFCRPLVYWRGHVPPVPPSGSAHGASATATEGATSNSGEFNSGNKQMIGGGGQESLLRRGVGDGREMPKILRSITMQCPVSLHGDRYSPLKDTVTLKLGFGVTQGHRKWHYSIEHVRLYIRLP